jgi:hypothetical protein
MTTDKKGFLRRSGVLIAACLILVFAGDSAAAASVITTRDDGAATAKGAQQPLGRLSATPPAPHRNQGVAGTHRNSGVDSGKVAGKHQSGTTPAGSPNAAVGNGGGGGGSLPFTGLLAIPVLLLGFGLLGVGLLTRRRSRPASAAS